MKADDLIRDPVFQLNLLIWAAKDQPNAGAAVVQPVFFRHGYRLMYVENPFAFPVPIQRQLQSVSDIVKTPSADVILSNSDTAVAFYVEAKKDSFSVESTNCRQARAHLIAAGPAFSEVYPTAKRCRLVYALPETCRTGMEPTLAALSVDVHGRGFIPGPFSIHGFVVEDGHVGYNIDESSRQDLGASETRFPLLPISDDGETDPSPLLLVYTDCDSYDPSNRGRYRRALIDQVHAHLMCMFQHCDPFVAFTVSPEEVLLKTTGGVFAFVGGDTRKSMRILVRDNIFKRIVEFWQDKNADVFQRRGFDLSVRFGDEYNKELFLEWLEDHGRTKFSDEPADAEEVVSGELPLFEDPEAAAPAT